MKLLLAFCWFVQQHLDAVHLTGAIFIRHYRSSEMAIELRRIFADF